MKTKIDIGPTVESTIEIEPEIEEIIETELKKKKIWMFWE
jgi:hypothetical protein